MLSEGDKGNKGNEAKLDKHWNDQPVKFDYK